MQIEKSSQGDLLELTVEGRLDNDSSVYFREEIEAAAREGWHRILVDLNGVTYLSSSGIAALVDAKKRMDRLSGFFGIHNTSPHVEQILRLTRLLETLRCDPQKARSGPGMSGTVLALSAATRFVEEDGLELTIYALGDSEPLACRVFGNAQSLFEANGSRPRARNVSFGKQTFGFGLGALGGAGRPAAADATAARAPATAKMSVLAADAVETRYGEFLAVAGAVAQSAHKSDGLPDYLLAAGDFVPSAEIVYGVQCEGEFPFLIRFSPKETDRQFGLSKLISSGLRQTNARLAGFVILADCAGLVGAQLRQSPASLPQDGSDRFSLPGLRQWLSFSAEQIHRHNLVLIVGIAALGPLDDSPLSALLRPMDAHGLLHGHFHAAVFPYRPLKKRVLPLAPSVNELFDSGSIEDVLHLLRDDRPITGLGESELFGGACWLGPIGKPVLMEERA
jgi:anti-anti-sigma factor